jgi:4-amino-4-deoxy-L-arabinose transferase-like glycosyltransferase
MPGYPLLIGFWSTVLGGDYILGAKVASIFSGSLLIVVAYLLGKSLYGRSVAITASLLIAINTALITVSTWELPEATYSLAIFSAIAVTIWTVRRQRLAIWVLAGLLYGFSYWVRPEGFFYLGLVPILVFIEHWFQTRKPFSRELVLRIGVFLIAGLLFVIPNILHTHRETGAWTINGRTVWAALIYSKELDRNSLEGSLDYEKSLFKLTPDKQSTMLEGGFKRTSVLASYSKNLGFKIRAMIKNWWRTCKLLPSVFNRILILFTLVGLFHLKWTFQDRRAEFYLLGALLPWVIIYPLYEIQFEKLTPVVPILTLWASLGVVSVAKRISFLGELSKPLIIQKPAVIIAAILLLVAFVEFPTFIRPIRDRGFYQNMEDDVVNRKVAEWIKKNLPEDTILMSRKAFIPVYANRKFVMLPFADYKDLIAYSRLKGVNVIIMDEKYKQVRPQLAFLLGQPDQLKDLVPIYATQNEKGQKIILYKLLPENQVQTH